MPCTRRGVDFLWAVCDPHGELWTLGPSHHVVEGEDGTITVTPSLHDYAPGGWHGHLTEGRWGP